jgi:phosphoglycerol transferase
MAQRVTATDRTADMSTTDPISGVRRRGAEAWRSAGRDVDEAWKLPDARFEFRAAAIDLTVLLTGVGAVLLGWLQPWKNDLRVPLGYVNDSLPVNMQIQSIIENGWFQRNDRLGAPFGQELYDYPFGVDNGNFAIMRALTLLSKDSHLLFNAFYVLGFFTVAVTAYFVAVRLGTTRIIAIGISFVYAIAPYHFLRIGHTLLAHYAVVPLAVLLAVRAASGRSFSRSERRWASILGWAATCIALGSFGAYYAVFGLITIAMFAAFSALANRSRRPLVAAAALGGVTSVALVANLSGSLLYRMRNGVNDDAVLRIPLELDLYSFRLVQALTPPPGTRLPGFDGLTSVLDEGSPSEPSMYFGLIGAVALIAMLLWAVARIVRRTTDDGPASAPLMGAFVGATVAWILIASAGGLNWLLLLTGLSELRAWGRVSILLLFLVLIWSGRWLGATMTRRSMSTGAQLAVVSVLALVAVTDQVGVAPPPDEWALDFEIDQDFFTAVDERLADGTTIGQLPAIRFPEGGRLNGAGPYDGLRPFLHTDGIRFSFGGMRGREAEWQQQLNELDVDDQIDAMIATGYDAILYLVPGYPDAGAAVIAALDNLGVDDVIVSTNGTWLFIELDSSMTDLDFDELSELRAELFAGIAVDAFTPVR